jgi:hypothetical protein
MTTLGKVSKPLYLTSLRAGTKPPWARSSVIVGPNFEVFSAGTLWVRLFSYGDIHIVEP